MMMLTGPHFSCLLLVLSMLISFTASEDDLVVVTSSGPIKGKQLPTSSGTVSAYLGIPYAEPPLGKLRFQKPRPHLSWSHILEATHFGNSCPQINVTNFPDAALLVPNTPLSEDCLFLNLWVPHPRPSTPAPVVVWIHGGGFISGTASLDVYNGALLAATENIIVASMNYRLGALGFFYLPPAAPGNVGLWDQHLALKWVKENAAVFGGDPAQVTIIGHSAGAAAVGFHLLSPASQPLFTRAVLQSGAPNAPWAWMSPLDAKNLTVGMSHLMGCGSANHSAVVSCLQEKEIGHQWLSNLGGAFSLTTDGEFLIDEPQKLLETGTVPAKSVKTGITADEGSSIAFLMIPDVRTMDGKMTEEQFLEVVSATLSGKYNESVAKAVVLKYTESIHGPVNPLQALAYFLKDYYFACPMADFAAKVAEARSPTYVYSFNQRPLASLWPEWAGAFHGAEIAYLFGNSLRGTGSLNTEADAAFSHKVMRYWANFARNGNPTGSSSSEVHWPLYNATDQDVFHISSTETQIGQISPALNCEFLTTLFLNATHKFAAMLHLLWWFIILTSQPDFSSASEDDLLVVTSSGPIKGKRVPAGSGNVTAYLGIPYAEPPLGRLRFKKPIPHQPWSAVLEATSFGNACNQIRSFGSPYSDMWVPKTTFSEDCLFLNLWVPHPRPSVPVPVLIWIHGGSFVAGAGSLDLYNGALLAATENVIVASINYRLGIMGFFYLPPDAPGNVGLWDQYLAMKWVKENAAVFGGDPALLTLFGQSAGAAAVGFHLLSPISRPLFARAVIQSGAPNAPWAWKHPKDAQWSAETLGFLMNCSQHNNRTTVSCLQEKEAENQIFSLFGSDFLPTTDGVFLPDAPRKLVQNEIPEKKPLLIGVTGDDGSVYVSFIVSDTIMNGSFLTWRQVLNGVKSVRTVSNILEEDIIEAIALKYTEGGDRPEKYHRALTQFAKDYYFVCPLVDLATQMVAGRSPVYVYSFNHYINGSIWDEWMGAAHGSDVPFLFGTLASILEGNQTDPERDAALSRRMMRYWAEFARSGNPTGSRDDEVQWPLYNATEHNFFPISVDGPQDTQRSFVHHCDFLAKQTFCTKVTPSPQTMKERAKSGKS